MGHETKSKSARKSKLPNFIKFNKIVFGNFIRISITYFQYYAFDDTIERVVDLVQNDTNDLLNILIEPLTRFSKVSFHKLCTPDFLQNSTDNLIKINEKTGKVPVDTCAVVRTRPNWKNSRLRRFGKLSQGMVLKLKKSGNFRSLLALNTRSYSLPRSITGFLF